MFHEESVYGEWVQYGVRRVSIAAFLAVVAAPSIDALIAHRRADLPPIVEGEFRSQKKLFNAALFPAAPAVEVIDALTTYRIEEYQEQEDTFHPQVLRFSAALIPPVIDVLTAFRRASSWMVISPDEEPLVQRGQRLIIAVAPVTPVVPAIVAYRRDLSGSLFDEFIERYDPQRSPLPLAVYIPAVPAIIVEAIVSYRRDDYSTWARAETYIPQRLIPELSSYIPTVFGPEVTLRRFHTGVWEDPIRVAEWIDPERTATFEIPDRITEWD